MSVLVDTADVVVATVGSQWSVWVDLITSEVVVTDEVKTWLVDIRTEWQLLSLQNFWESITAIIWMVDLSNLNGVISQEVVDNVWEIIAFGEEAEDFTVVVQELLLGWNFTTAKGLLLVFAEFAIVGTGNLDLRLSEVIRWLAGGLWLWLSKILKNRGVKFL